MLLCFHVGLSFLALFSVSSSLPSPYDVRMVAVDMNYTLQWAWRSKQLNGSVNFTADYAFWQDDGSYKQACKGSGELKCDFTHKLNFRGTYQIRVRAEANSKHSNWTHLRFTPDEDVLLGPPSKVDMEVHMDMIILIISESVMSSVMTLRYKLWYWERLKPEQVTCTTCSHAQICNMNPPTPQAYFTHFTNFVGIVIKMDQKVFENPHASLTSLKPWTEYCVQVSVFNQDYNKRSNFTSPQCVSTTGQHLAWLRWLAVLCSILVLGFLLLFFCRFTRNLPEYKTPDSILGLPFDHPPLLEAQEMSCDVALVTALTPQLESPQLSQQQYDGIAELQAVSCQWSNGSEQDSGIGSGEES